ncbi:MAG: carbohydrate kinase [Planctomycetales bacterium]|nr:carbohydrate kinase [Planctomycetales bacterium]
MNSAQLSTGRLNELIGRFAKARIAVVGDFFLDKYLDCDPEIEERSVETGRAAHQVCRIRTSPGCAGVVTANLASLGVKELFAIGIIGADGEGFDLCNRLNEFGCSTEHLHTVADRMTPTYLKPRNLRDASLAGEHDRYDTKNRSETPAAYAEQVMQSVDAILPHVDALMIMDQVEERNRGSITDTVRTAICERAAKLKSEVVFWADSRRRIREYRHVIIKPNEFEALGRELWLPGEEVDLATLRSAVEQLRAEVAAPIFVTRGERGMFVTDPEWTAVPGVRVEGEIDATGAGDSASAGTVAALCAGATLPEAGVVANLVASITIQQLATTGVAKPEQLPDRLAMWNQQQDTKETN